MRTQSKSFRRAATLFAGSALAALGAPAIAQDAARMDQAVHEQAENSRYMGVALVAIGDEIVLDKGYGSANLEWDIANNPDTKFRLGSITKQFTAVSILQLHERGQLDIAKPIGTYIEDIPAHWAEITVAHLLHHTSGIPNITSFDDFRSWKFSPATLDELIARFSDKELDFAPGSKWAYSNSGYMVLVAIIENVSGQSLEDYMQANLFDPLDMADTGADRSAQILPMRASGYSPTADGLVNAEYVHMSIPRGGGNLYSTTGDLLKWQRGLFGGRLLSPDTLELYKKPVEFETMGEAKYAAGVLVEPMEGDTVYWHGGGIEGFNTWLGHDPANDITVVVLANVNGGSANKLGRSLMTLAHGGEIELVSERKVIALGAEELAQYTGTYRFDDAFQITTRIEDGQLVAQTDNPPTFVLHPLGQDRFFPKEVDAMLQFHRNESGAVVSVTLDQSGRSRNGTRE